jgi:hypothetical protein
VARDVTRLRNGDPNGDQILPTIRGSLALRRPNHHQHHHYEHHGPEEPLPFILFHIIGNHTWIINYVRTRPGAIRTLQFKLNQSRSTYLFWLLPAVVFDLLATPGSQTKSYTGLNNQVLQKTAHERTTTAKNMGILKYHQTSLIMYESCWPLACLGGLIKPNQASHQGARWTSSVSMLKVPVLALVMETSAVWPWCRRSFQDICRGL